MPIHLVTGPANSGKANVVLGAARAAAARGQEPLLVVPTYADQARYRRELAEGGVAFGTRVERFDGLLAQVATRAGAGAATIGSLARERLIARATGATPALAAALAETIAELASQRIGPRRLRGALRVWSVAGGRPAQLALFGEPPIGGGAGERMALERICAAYERYHEQLGEMRARDRELNACAALDELRRRPARWGGTPVLVYGFDDLTELQLDAIETLGGPVGADVTVSLAYEPARLVFAGRATTFQRLLPLAGEHTQLPARADYYDARSRTALHHLERSLLADAAERVAPGDAVRLLEAATPRAEMALIAAEASALIGGGVAPDQIAIVHRSPASIAQLLREALDEHGVPHAIGTRLGFADTAIGRALLGALRCALGVGELGDLLAWLRCPGVLEQPLLADRLEARALSVGAKSAAQARALWEAERWPLQQLDRLADAARESLPRLADTLIAELERLFAAPRRGLGTVLGEHELQEAGALAAARRALEELRELSLRLRDDGSAGEALAVLERLSFRAGDAGLSGRVAVIDPLGLRARRVRALFACGMQESVFPAAPAPPLIGEHDRRALARASGLALRPAPDTLAAERYLLYALVSRPEQCLTLSWHAADEDGVPTPRSLFVDDVCDAFEQTLTVRRPTAEESWSTRTSDLLAEGSGRGRASRFPGGEPGYGRTSPSVCEPSASERSDRRRGDTPPVGGTIEPLQDERVLVWLRERRLWSASSLELWASCPVRWFVERLLGAEQLGPDAEPLVRGSLAHAALKLTLERLRERTGSARLTTASLASARELLLAALAELEREHPLSTAPERRPGARRRLHRELERYLEAAAAQPSPLEPTHLELQFGFEDQSQPEDQAQPEDQRPPEDQSQAVLGDRAAAVVGDRTRPSLPPLDLGGGIAVRGRIDRVDVGLDGVAIVYDYKGRAAPPSARWLRDGSWQVALYMRAVRELLDRRPIGGFYQPLAGRELAPRGALDADAGIELECVRTDRLDHDAFERLLEDCASAAREAALQARSGALEPRPDTCAYGGGCSYPTICRCER